MGVFRHSIECEGAEETHLDRCKNVCYNNRKQQRLYSSTNGYGRLMLMGFLVVPGNRNNHFPLKNYEKI